MTSQSLQKLAGGLLTAVFVALPAQAADFQFSSLIRAGNGSWQATIGNASSPLTSRSSQLFEVGYVLNTNTAFVRTYRGTSASDPYDEQTYSPGGVGPGGNVQWSIAASSFFVSANRPGTTINLSNLQFLGGVNVISPLQSTPMAASGVASGVVTTAHAGNVVFQTGASGNWTLRGLVQRTIGSGSAAEVRVGLSASSSSTTSETPEPATGALASAALVAALGWRLRNRRLSSRR